MEELIEAYKEYINLLHRELDELAIFANTYGWKSQRIKEGKILRDRIKKLEKDSWVKIK